MGTVADHERADVPTDLDEPRGRDGRWFVAISMGFLVLFVLFLVFVSPRLQDSLGLNQPLPFNQPDATTTVPLLLGEVEVGEVVWDASGVCAEVTDPGGAVFRTCAVPDPLRPIWAIDAPDEATDPFLLVATPPDVASIEGRTTDGETFAALTQVRELPAAWAIVPLPEGAVVDEMTAFNVEASDVGGAQCGVEDAPTGGPERLAGGCLVPQED